MKRLTRLIERNISGKKVLALFILTNVLYIFMLTITIPQTMAYANGMDLLDMKPMGYDFDYVSKLFNSLGVIGLKTYLTHQIPVDMIYPLLFGLTYCFLLAYLLKKLNKLKTPYSYLCLLPIIAGISDYAENIGIITLLTSYPDIKEFTVTTTNMFSVLKSISTSIFFLTLIILLIVLAINVLRSKNKQSKQN